MDAENIIELLGGTNAVASLLGVQPPSVSGWKKAKRLPDDKLIRLAPLLHARGFVARWDLRPNDWHLIWPELVGTLGAPAVQAKEAA